jgi:hypothetical protein
MKKIEYEQKQVVVQNKKVKWQCEICGKEYKYEGDAYICEKRHKNKEALSKVESKFKAGDVVIYVDAWYGSTKYGHIYRPTPIDYYRRWGYSVIIDNYPTVMEEEDLTYVCSKEEFGSIIKNIKSKIKEQLDIPKKNVRVSMLANGEFEVSFRMNDKTIPVIKVKED